MKPWIIPTALAAAAILGWVWLMPSIEDESARIAAAASTKWHANYQRGSEFWNDPRTAGYQLLIDVKQGDVVSSRSVAPLGKAPPARSNEPVPIWMARCIYTQCIQEN